MRIDAILRQNPQFCASSHYFRDINCSNCLSLIKVKVTEYNISNGAIGWRIPTSIKVDRVHILTQCATVSEILRFEMVDLENLGKGYNLRK